MRMLSLLKRPSHAEGEEVHADAGAAACEVRSTTQQVVQQQ
jgi:hypothetical protein